MKGKIFITSTGYDPELGKAVKDPYLGECPTLGACRPDIREQLGLDDWIFCLSGKIPIAAQYVMGGFQIAEKITHADAYRRFEDLRLRMGADGDVTGNIIVNAAGKQHKLDHHNSFERRTQNYIVGKNPLVLASTAEIAQGREHTLEILQDVFQKKGDKPRDVIGRCSNLTAKQVEKLIAHLSALKDRQLTDFTDAVRRSG